MHRFLLLVTLLALSAIAAQAAEAPATVTIPDCLVSLINEAQVPAREAGFIAKIDIHEGQQVAADELMARIDDSQARMDLRIAEADYKAAKAEADSTVNVDYAKATYDSSVAEWNRAIDANKKTPHAVAETEVEKLRLTCVQTQLAIQKARNDLTIAGHKAEVSLGKMNATEEAVKRRQIKSPLNGVVVDVKRHVGEWVQAGEPMAYVVGLDRLRLEGILNSGEFEHVEINGRPVIVTVKFARGHEEAFNGKIVFVDPLVRARGKFRVWAEVENRKVGDSWLLLPGRNASMTIQLR
jgi:multidrug resistance efflux pump